MKCRKCGEECKEGRLFCLKCGNPIDVVEDMDETLETISNDVEQFMGTKTDVLPEILIDEEGNDLVEETDDFPEDLDISDLLSTKEIKKNIDHDTWEKDIKIHPEPIELEEDENSYKEPERIFKDNRYSKGKITGKRKKKEKHSSTKAGVVVVLVVITVAVFTSYLLLSTHSDEKFNQYYKKGEMMYNGMNYERAVTEFLHADRVAYNDELHKQAKEMLYKSYQGCSQYQKAIHVLDELIKKDGDNPEYFIAKYAVYQTAGKTDAAKKLMEELKGTEIGDTLEIYKASTPVADQKSGSYNKPVILTLSTIKGNRIFYTTNGKEPTSSSKEYKEPLVFGSNKNFRLKAVSISPQGIKSKVLTLRFRIRAIPNPYIFPKSGEYNQTQKIQVKVPEGCKAFYTTDGSEPDENSTPYTKELDMPIGNTLFSVVFYNSVGVKSDTITRIYNLVPQRTYSYEAAYSYLINQLLNQGILTQWNGASEKGKVVFEYAGTTVLNGYEYYIISAVRSAADGKVNGKALYGIGTKQCDLYRLEKEGDSYEVDADLKIPD